MRETVVKVVLVLVLMVMALVASGCVPDPGPEATQATIDRNNTLDCQRSGRDDCGSLFPENP